MKYLIINGSPRKKNTWMMVQQVQKNLDGSFEEIHLFEEEIPLCKGCYNCIMKGEQFCPHKNLIMPIVEKIKEADGLIIASPVYAMNVTALLKNFLDHTAYLYHRPEFFTKKAIVVVSTAGAGQKKVANYIDETLRHWGVNKVYKISLACGGKDSLEREKIDKIAKKFRKDMDSEKLHSPKFMDIIFYNVWRAMALTDEPIPADKEFWFKTELVKYDFAPEVKLGIIKKIFAKLMFNILKRVM
ncbi:flavodoxin family protein [Methanobrevibacter sp.]|uniref:flavodoxin family protein n=1 Tax=Methanobrevibacter sp. TaxID=66852 RepID=UPI0025CECEFD|nr:NAD(P)H-dependent oxidoreductase [Methanobrevibacter sp.]MBQ2832037.1 NAD(P)H-dependent oxidoreductase [Methanobrevibacter sp.]